MNRLNIITLGVKDIKKSFEFYKAMGFHTHLEADEVSDIVFFDNEGTKLALYPIEALLLDIDLADPPKKTSGFGGITLAYNCKSKEAVDETIDRAKSLGAQVLKAPEQVFWGGYSGYFEDFDGHVFEVAYSDTFKFDKQNMLVFDE